MSNLKNQLRNLEKSIPDTEKLTQAFHVLAVVLIPPSGKPIETLDEAIEIREAMNEETIVFTAEEKNVLNTIIDFIKKNPMNEKNAMHLLNTYRPSETMGGRRKKSRKSKRKSRKTLKRK